MAEDCSLRVRFSEVLSKESPPRFLSSRVELLLLSSFADFLRDHIWKEVSVEESISIASE
jgi:hypothetical protein